MRLLLFATSCKETQSALQGGKWKNTFHAYPAQMAFPMGVVWTVQPFWSHHPRYPLPEVRVEAPSVEGDFRDAQQLPTVLLLSCWMRSNSTAMMSYALQCAPARFGAYCCRYAMNSSTLRLYPLGAVRGLPLESKSR